MYGFEGWLLKVDGKEFPTDYIAADTYTSTPDQKTDIDDYTDNDGVFHRNVLPAKATKIEFDIKPIRLYDRNIVQGLFPSNADSCTVEYWNDLTMSYQTGTFYVPDISFQIYMIYKETKDILYQPTRIAFIEYGAIR